MDQFYRADSELGLRLEEIKAALLKSLEGKSPKHTLIIPPDFTRFHSNAGYITNVYYHALTEMGCEVDILPALGTQAARSAAHKGTHLQSRTAGHSADHRLHPAPRCLHGHACG